MKNAGLSEAQAGIRTARRNISNLRYADDTTLMAENEKELKNLLLRVKKESKIGSSYTPVMDSCQCTAKPIQYGKVK